jgi:hypothetical protein
MADTLSLLVLDPLCTTMQGTVIDITVAEALIMKPNCFNEDCYLLPKDTDIGRYIRMLQRSLLD